MRPAFLGTMWKRMPADAWVTPTDIPAAEAAALKVLYDNGGGAGWTTSTGWGTGDAADYYGITVSGGHVTAIDLSSNLLSISSAFDIDALTYLQSLDMSDNGILSADIDLVIDSLYSAAPTWTHASGITITIDGTNEEPGGTWQTAATPTTAQEKLFDMVVDIGANYVPITVTYTTVLGAELIANGDFSMASDWSGALTSGTWSMDGGTLNFVGCGNLSVAYQSIGDKKFKTFRVRYDVVECSAGAFAPLLNGTTNIIGASRSSPGTYTEDLHYNSNESNVNFSISAVGTTTGKVDNVSVRQVL